MHRLLLSLHIFVGFGAMAGGLAATIDPLTPLGISLEALKHSPFENYLIPGIILFTVLGVGNGISAFLLLSKSKFRGWASTTFSWALVIWIVVQCIMLRAIHFLHILFLVIGLVEISLSLLLITATFKKGESTSIID